MKFIFIFFSLSFFMFSCSTSDESANNDKLPENNEQVLDDNSDNLNDDLEDDVVDNNFYALNVGNWWVYKYYSYNLNTDDYTFSGVIDSVSIVGLEDISDKPYYKFRRFTTGNDQGSSLYRPNGESFEFFSDDNGNLVNEEGAIKFTNNNFENRLLEENDWGDIYEVLFEGNLLISVEAGEFDCVKSVRYAILPDGKRSPSSDFFYYSDGYGLIYSTISFVSQSKPILIRRLDSYSVQ